MTDDGDNVRKLAEYKRGRRRGRDGGGPQPPGGEGGDADAEAEAIRLVAGEMSAALDQAEAKLLQHGPGPIFQRSGILVHITDRPAYRSDGVKDTQQAIAAIGPAALTERFSQVATFMRFDKRANDWVRTDPPKALADAYFARPVWKLPPVRQVIHTPTVRPDGSILSAAGYDGQTGLFLTTSLPGARVPDRPKRRDAELANDTLVEVLGSFPFVEDPPGQALAVAMAGLLGAVVRSTLPTCPLIGVTAPQAGTGKSYLVDIIAAIATGHRAVGIVTGSNPEEFEKSIGAELQAGRPLLSLDNMTQPIAGQLLCMVTSQERVSVRILGQSKTVDVPTSTALFATGNQLRVQGDMTRRALLCRLDAGLEHPEERTFDSNLLAEVVQRRAELVSAALTILRWHHTNPDPAPLVGRRFAGFDDWCARVRDPLLALGHVDPVGALDVTRSVDMEAARLAALVEAWALRFGEDPQSAGEVVAVAARDRSDGHPDVPDLAEAIDAVAGDRRANSASRRLGNYLAKVEGRIIVGKRFSRGGMHAKTIRWQLRAV